MDEQVKNLMDYCLPFQNDILEIEKNMKITDPQAYQAFMTLINNYIMQKYDK